MKKLITLVTLSLFSTSLLAQSIPFRLTSHNNLVVKVILNQKDTVNLMLHTGATDVMLIEDALPKLKSINFSGKVDSVGSWGGGNNSSDYSVKNSVKIGAFDFQNIIVWKDQYSGPETDGKFGISLFEKKFLAFDFDKNSLTVTESLPRKLKKYQKFELKYERGLVFIKAICKVGIQDFEKEFMIHSGYAGDVLLDDKFANENKIGEYIKITGEKKLKDSFGNTVVTKKGILPTLKIGKFELSDIPVGFFEGTIGRQTISVIGGDIFKRFNWIFDAERKYVYLKSNKNYKVEYSKV
jgi:hypothetical protein